MNAPSNQEIERQYRVLKQTLEMHAILRDEYAFKSLFIEILLLICSVIFCATTFASDQLYNSLGLTPSISRTILGIASIIAFIISLILLLVDWKGKSAQHSKAVEKWSIVLEQFRKNRSGDDTWPDSSYEMLSDKYWEADRNSIKIPNKRFNSLKSKYLRKITISKLKSDYPGCPRFVLSTLIILIDSFKAIKASFRSESEV